MHIDVIQTDPRRPRFASPGDDKRRHAQPRQRRRASVGKCHAQPLKAASGICSMLIITAFTIFFTSSCITLNRPSEQEMAAWRTEQDHIRAKISEEQKPLRTELAQRKFNAPFLWRIEKSGKTSYLLGTMHVTVSANELPYGVHSLFRKSKTHVYESDGELDLRAAALSDDDESINTEEPCLDKTLTPAAWKKFNHDLMPLREFDFRCLPPGDAYNFYISIRSMILTDDRVSLDRELMYETKTNKTTMELLETSAEALTALRALKQTPAKKTMTALEFSNYLMNDPLKDIKAEIARTYTLAKAYKSGDFAQITAATGDEMSEIYPALIARRNELWLPKLKDILNNGDAFVAVGVAHMMGPQSLILLLEKDGFKIHRVQLSELKF